MQTVRKAGGLSGFPRRDESIYDTFGAGHSSTSISAALGTFFFFFNKEGLYISSYFLKLNNETQN